MDIGEGSQKFRARWGPALVDGVCLTPRNISHKVITDNFVVLCQTVGA